MRRFLFAVVFLAFLSSAIWSCPATAQGRKGAIAGKATDTAGGVLKGAQVSIESLNINTTTDVQGQFFISDLNPGSYALTISYIGFAPLTKTVEVAAGQTANWDATLKLQSQNLQILVTADRPSAEAEAVNTERTADNIVQVLPAEVIRSLPNANMADALGRLPSVTIERDEGEGKYVQVRGTEPRLTNTTIDGINVPSPESGVRQIKFDAIPADIVESVEINKTLQANMDGDGVGGSVNLITKTAGERPTVNLSTMGGYTPIINGRGLVETTGTVGQRFGSKKRFGALIGGSYDWNGRGIDDIEPVPDIATNLPGQPRYFDTVDIREYRYYRSRWGLAGSADYKLAEASNIYFRYLYSDFKNNGDRWVYTINDNTPNAGLLNTNGGVPSFNAQLRRPDYAIGSLVLGGKHVLSTTWYAWDISVSRASQTGQVGDQNATYKATNLSSSSCEYDPTATTNTYLPQWTPNCFTEAYNPANYTLTDVNLNKGLSAQLNLQVTGAIAKRYHLGSHLASIEFGGKFRNAHKFDNEYVLDYTPNSGEMLGMPPSILSNNNYYSGAYKLGPNPSFQSIFAAMNANLNNFTQTSTAGGNSTNYDLIEKVSAGYVMNTIDFNKIHIVAGVRFEGTNLYTDTFQTDTSCGAPLVGGVCVPPATTVTTSGFVPANGSYVKILPSASIRYALTANAGLRLAYSRGLSRPNPQDIAQAGTIDTSTSQVQKTLGNPNLKPEIADNVDLLFEYYLKPFGMISAGYFYKNLTDPIIASETVTPSLDVKQPFNAGSAWLNGFEASYLQHLSFLPGMLGGLGISANYGYTASRVSGIAGRSDHPRLLRNAPNTWNISPTYDRGRFSVRVGLSYNEANINAYIFKDGAQGGIKGPLGDDYFFTHLQVDAQGSINMGHGLSYVMYGLNLTNEVFGFYFGSPQNFHQREFYRPTVAFGLRWSPVREK
jgi:TonB-dependent receptor